MSAELYHKELLRLAAEAHGAGRLADAQATATVDNPLCGDRITVDVTTADGRIARVGYDVKACLLCQASASIIGAAATGASRQDIQAIADLIGGMLRQHRPLPGGAWAKLEVFTPVAPHKSRHRCVLLPFEALLKAMAESAAG